MPILKALGLGVAILVLKLLTPEIFGSIEQIFLIALELLEANLAAVEALSTSI